MGYAALAVEDLKPVAFSADKTSCGEQTVFNLSAHDITGTMYYIMLESRRSTALLINQLGIKRNGGFE